MSNDHPTQREDQELQALFRHARVRQPPPADFEAEVRSALHAQWRSDVSRRRQRRLVGLGLAAGLAVAVVLVRLLAPPAAAPEPEAVASMAKRSGSVLVTGPDHSGSSGAVQNPGALYAGSTLDTSSDALLALHWMGGESVRVAGNTRLRLVSGHEIELQSGKVYVDSRGRNGAANAADPLLIRTRAGVIRHIGTQYLASLHASGLDVSVREGQVAVNTGDSETVADRGEQLSIDSSGDTRTIEVATWGELWAWTETAAPPIELDGRTIMEFLQLVAREAGHELEFSDARAEDIARRSTLSGSIDLPPLRALHVVLQTTDLVANTENGRILIQAK